MIPFYQDMTDQLKQLFRHHFGSDPDRFFFTPGRVNLMGEHLDYNGGPVLPAIITPGIFSATGRSTGGQVRIASNLYDEPAIIPLKKTRTRSHTWHDYPAGMITVLEEHGYNPPGTDILLTSTLPPGSGLSSSAALEVITALSLIPELFTTDDEKIQLALMAQEAENRFIGVQCGIMDQFAVSVGKPDHALLIETDSLLHSHIPCRLPGYTFLIMNTRHARTLEGSAFNDRRTQCDRALSVVQQNSSLTHLARSTRADLADIADPLLRRRALHVVSETERVRASVAFLKNNDAARFGMAMTESHWSLRDNFEVTGRHLDTIVDAALAHPGCAGARMTGAGFGGCAIALAETEAVTSITEHVQEVYENKTGITPEIFPITSTMPAGEIKEMP